MSKTSQKKSKFIAGLDIGTSKITFVIGSIQSPWAPANVYEEKNQNAKAVASNLRSGAQTANNSIGSLHDWNMNIVGLGSAPSHGIRQGAVVNVEATIESIRRAREEAELMAGEVVDEVYVSIGGTHIKSFDSKGMVAIRNKEVRPEDVTRVIEAAKAVVVPADREVLHVLPREFKLDDQEGIFDPIGMTGVRLEANVHIITAGRTSLQNALKCTEKAGLKVKSLVLQQFASALAVLSEDEKKLGAVVVDIGGGTSDVIVYANGSVGYTGLVPVGGMQFTQDLSMGLRTPFANAELLKKKFGAAIAEFIDEKEMIEVDGVGGRNPRSILRRELGQIIEARAEETMLLIYQDILASGLSQQLGSGVVLTGGGADLEALVEMGEFVFDMPVRKGLPLKVGGLVDVVRSPSYATAVGLLMYGLEKEKINISPEIETGMQEFISGFSSKMKDFFGELLKN